MTRKTLALIMCMGTSLGTAAQDPIELLNCGFDEVHQAHLSDPSFQMAINTQDLLLADLAESWRGGGSSIVIPVVVHVIHKGEPIGTGTNRSDSSIQALLDCTNARYAAMLGNSIDTDISFCLAQIDPSGQPSSGIDRIDGNIFPNYYTHGMTWPFASGCPGPTVIDIAQTLHWPTSEYYNLYLVSIFCGAGQLGFAYYPSSPTFYDGAYMRSTTTNCYLLTHELGHGMGLYHTFEGATSTQCPPNSNCAVEGDRVCDTPPHRLNDCTIANNPCDTNMTLWPNSRLNYMSYCMAAQDRFSPLQKVRLHNSINIHRSTLLSSTVCNPATAIALTGSLGDHHPLTWSIPDDGSEHLEMNRIVSGTIYDMLGRVHSTFHSTSHIPLNGMPHGTYLLRTIEGVSLRFIW